MVSDRTLRRRRAQARALGQQPQAAESDNPKGVQLGLLKWWSLMPYIRGCWLLTEQGKKWIDERLDAGHTLQECAAELGISIEREDVDGSIWLAGSAFAPTEPIAPPPPPPPSPPAAPQPEEIHLPRYIDPAFDPMGHKRQQRMQKKIDDWKKANPNG